MRILQEVLFEVKDELVLVPVPHGYQCCMCGKFKHPKQFTVDKKRPGNVGSLCRACKSLHIDKSYTRRSKEQRAIKFKTRRYGITEEAYRALLEQQGGVCAICKKPETKYIKGALATLAVDHCHATGVIRGLLCDRCNRGLGMFHEDTARMAVAIEYLRVKDSEETRI